MNLVGPDLRVEAYVAIDAAGRLYKVETRCQREDIPVLLRALAQAMASLANDYGYDLRKVLESS